MSTIWFLLALAVLAAGLTDNERRILIERVTAKLISHVQAQRAEKEAAFKRSFQLLRFMKRTDTTHPCTRHSLQLEASELNVPLSNHGLRIVAPQVLDLGYCELAAGSFCPQEGTIRSSLLTASGHGSKHNCGPKELGSIDVMFCMDEDDCDHQTGIPDVLVKSCQCV